MFTRKRAARLPIRESDLRKLTSLGAAAGQDLTPTLSQFDVMPDAGVAEDVIGIGSTVSFAEVVSGVTKTIQLVEPDKTDAASLKISVLSPLGLALIGLVPGDYVQWQLSKDVSRTLQVGIVMQAPTQTKG